MAQNNCDNPEFFAENSQLPRQVHGLDGAPEWPEINSMLPESRLAVMPATSHTAVINQPELLHAFIEPFLQGDIPKGFFE